MKGRGFTYTPVQVTSTSTTPVDLQGDVDLARKYGYGISEPFAAAVRKLNDSQPAPDPAAGLSGDQKKAFDRALGGDDPDSSGRLQGDDTVTVDTGQGQVSYHKNSCTAQAHEKVQGDTSAWLTAQAVVGHLTGEAWDGIRADPAWAEANRAWSACMAKRGYHYTDPEAPSQDLQRHIATAGKADAVTWQRREVDTAVADAECTVSTGWLNTQDQLVRKYEEQVTKAHAGEVMGFTELRRKAVERATEINRAAG